MYTRRPGGPKIGKNGCTGKHSVLQPKAHIEETVVWEMYSAAFLVSTRTA